MSAHLLYFIYGVVKEILCKTALDGRESCPAPAGCPQRVIPSYGPLGDAPTTWLVSEHTLVSVPLRTARMMRTLLTLGTAHILIHLSQDKYVASVL